MKATMYIFGLLAVLCGIAAFWNPSHVWSSAVTGLMSFAAFLEVQDEKRMEE